MQERYSEDSWTIEGWFRSGVSSIDVGQSSTITRGDKRTDQDHNSLLGDKGAATTSKVVEAEPHSYSQLRSRRIHF
ncbi:hypothetical protein Tco_0531534 [Tanacetum coccineum]